MGKKSRENQQKRKEAESSGSSTSTATPATTFQAPAEKAPEEKPVEKKEEKKPWKKSDLKKEKQALQHQAAQQPLQQQPPQQSWGSQQQQQGWTTQAPQQQRGPQPQQGWGSQAPQQQRGPPPGMQQQRGPSSQQGWGSQSQQPRGMQQQYQDRSGTPRQSQPSQGGPPGRGGQGYQSGQQQSYQDRRPGGGAGYQDRGYSRPASAGYGQSNAVPEGSTFQVEANYVDLTIPTDLNEAFHYDVKIDPDKPKKMFRKAVDLYCQKQFKNLFVAFDGKASAYSCVKLPEKQLTTQEVTVTPEFGKPREFKVTLSKTKDLVIDMSILRTYGSSPGGLANKPMRALQCLEVVLAHQCHEKGVKAGRSFFYRPEAPENLLDGYELWYGLFQAAILGQRLLLNIDVSHKAFPKPNEPLVKLFNELSFRGNSRNFDNMVKGSDIIYTAPQTFDQTSKQYKVNQVSLDSAKTYKFKTDEGNMTTVYEYFRKKGYTLQYPDLPLIHVGPRDSKTYLPIELCRMAENQVSNKQTAQRQVTEIIKHSAISSWERKKKILGLFAYFHAKSSPIIEKFGIKLGREFIQIKATRLVAPQLEYAGNRTIKPQNGSWRTDGNPFFKTAGSNKGVLNWCVINLERNLNEAAIRNMGDILRKTCRNSKVPIDDRPNFEIKKIDSRDLSRTLAECVGKYDFVIVVLSRFGNSYADVKKAAELDKGMLTQCIKADTVERRANDSTLQNILLKLNSKLNGINQRIAGKSQNSIFAEGNHVMLIGADVTHPSPQQRSIPSIVGTCATSDPDCVRYNMQYRIQDPKKEIIVSMRDILIEHFKVYYEDQKRYPTHIIYYRDGVADGQFEQVLHDELRKGMDLACGEIEKLTKQTYRPKLTCIIVQKRNHTRFFPLNKQQAFGKFDNVFPGTCCTDVICHPKEKEFFLVSHESIKGTARPTKYIVIKDDSNFRLEDIQNLSYSLCHLFPRCNRSVSYPAPAYLAHLVAARGKVYIENENIQMNRLDELERRKKIVPRFTLGNPMFFV